MRPMHLPGSSLGNNRSRFCISHAADKPTEGGCEINAETWVCGPCWKRGYRTKNAAVRAQEAEAAQKEMRAAKAKRILDATRHAWEIEAEPEIAISE